MEWYRIKAGGQCPPYGISRVSVIQKGLISVPLNLDDTNEYFYLATSFLAKILSVFPNTIYEQIQSISCFSFRLNHRIVD